jgi:benzoyl-CoA 2,3-dioxygenase component B
VREDTPALSALNMRLRDDFVDDANAGVTRWNRVLERAGLEFRLRLPHVAFNRRIGEFAAIHADTDGKLMSADQWQARKETMLPSADDSRFVESLMRATHVPGAYASWIAPPRIGIDNKPGDFEYVKLEL